MNCPEMTENSFNMEESGVRERMKEPGVRERNMKTNSQNDTVYKEECPPVQRQRQETPYEVQCMDVTRTSITTTARRNGTNHSNQEGTEYIVTGHKAELINKDQPSMEDIITANA